MRIGYNGNITFNMYGLSKQTFIGQPAIFRTAFWNDIRNNNRVGGDDVVSCPGCAGYAHCYIGGLLRTQVHDHVLGITRGCK